MSTPNPFASFVSPVSKSGLPANPFSPLPATGAFPAPTTTPTPAASATSGMFGRQPTTPATTAFPAMPPAILGHWQGVEGLSNMPKPPTQPTNTPTLLSTMLPQANNPLLTPQAPAAASEGVTFDTPYKDLPAHYKTEVDRTFSEFKQPQKLATASIAKSKGAAFEEMKEHLRKLHLSVLKVENQQLELQRNIRPFLEEIKHVSRDVRISGTNGIQQLKQKSSALVTYGRAAGGIVIDENLPNNFFVAAAERLEARLSVCAEGVRYFAHQLQAKISALDRMNPAAAAAGNGHGMYGQVVRIGASQLLEVLRDQNEAFMRVAGSVAEVHRATEELRVIFLQLMNNPNNSMNYNNKNNNNKSGYYGGNQVAMSNRGAMNSAAAAAGLNPFELADRKEAADKRVLLQKLRNESLRHIQEHTPKQQGATGGVSGGNGAKPAEASGLGLGTGTGANLNIPGATAAPPAAGANPFAVPTAFSFSGAAGPPASGFASTLAPSTDNLTGLNTLAPKKSTKKK